MNYLNYFKPDFAITSYDLTKNGLELFDDFHSLCFIPLSQIVMVGDIQLKCNYGDIFIDSSTSIQFDESSKFYVLTLSLMNETDITITFKNDKLTLKRSEFLNKPCNIFKKIKRKIHYKFFKYYEEEFEFMTDKTHFENPELKKFKIHLTTLKNDIITAIKQSK
jgi:hypothetical protein